MAILIFTRIDRSPQAQMTIQAPIDDGSMMLTVDSVPFAELPSNLWQPFQRMVLIRLGRSDQHAFGNPADPAKEITGLLDSADLFPGKWSATVTADQVTIRSAG